MWVDAVYAVLVIVFMVAFIMFVIKVESVKRDSFERSRQEVMAQPQGPGRVALYSLVAKCIDTEVATHEFRSKIAQKHREFYLPVRCDEGVWSNRLVAMDACVVLVCKNTDASALLRLDVEASHTTYILIDGRVYVIRNVPRDLESHLQSRGVHGDTFLVFGLRLSDCSVNLVPFMGSLSMLSSSDMLKALTFGEQDSRPVQVLAYRTGA